MRKNKTIIKSILAILLAISPLTPILSNVYGDNIAQHTFQGVRPINELFPDENLANEIAQELGVADSSVAVTMDQLKVIENLDAPHANIKDLTGISYLENLSTVFLANNQINDLSPLENFKVFNFLDLNNNEISDLSPLNNVTVTIVQLDHNHIADLTPINDAFMIHARYQTITLPDTLFGIPTNFILLDRDGTTPAVAITGGSYDGRELIWDYSGQNQMLWGEEASSFTGTVTQTVIYDHDSKIIDYFPDVHLAQEIATVLNGNTNTNVSVSEEQLESITNLQVINSDVQDLKGMELLTGLRTLEIVGTEVSDIHPIGGLINLISLDLRNNEIENINSLSNLTNLTMLLLDENKIDDISALSTLVDLTSLKLASNQITDVTPLQNLNNLHTLNLNSNHIMDISSLPQVASTSGFSAINQTITLGTGYLLVPQKINLLNQYGEYPTVTNKIGAGTFVDGLLTWTETGKNKLEWIGPLSFQGVVEQEVQTAETIYGIFEDENLAKAIALTLNNNEANAVVVAGQLENIKTLNIAGRGISSLLGMERLIGLEFLNASMNRIDDLSHLAKLTKLQSLNLNFNNISDIEPLENMEDLTDLSLNHNALTDISILSNGFNIDRFTAINQSVLLPETPIGMSTPLTLLDSENQLPAITYLIGTGNYDSVSNTLTWSTVGDNYMTWASVTNFSGTLHQRVNNTTIKELFPDENLAQIVANRLGKDSINAVVTLDELESITSMAASNRGIHSLEGIQYLENVRELSFILNEITDITPLRNLNNLTALYIGYNNITDLSPLADLEKLDVLDINYNKVSDISIAANLPSLTRLRFSGNQVTDISSLDGIVDKLRDFNASNQIIDLPTVVVGQPTSITIRDVNGEAPLITYIDGQGGNYDAEKNELTWNAAGNNSFRWSSAHNTSFSGIVRQTVTPNE